MNARRRSLVLLSALVAVACVTSPPTLALRGGDDASRAGLGESRLGATRESVVAEADRRYATQPTCTFEKIAKPLSRRAYLHETCTYEPPDSELDGASLERVVLHFVDARLLRLDVVTAPVSREVAARVIDGLQARYGEPDSVATAPPASDDERHMTLTVWRVGVDEVGLKRFIDAEAGSDGHLQIHLLDAAAASETRALAAW